MKKSVPFEVFGANQFIYFDIMRLAQLEQAMGRSIYQIISGGEAGINFCLNALTVGLRHHYSKASPQLFAEKIGEYLEEGGELDDIAVLIVKAIILSGIFGKEIMDDDKENGEEKNAPATAEPSE